MTILILFQQSGYRTFKGFYTQHAWLLAARRVPSIHTRHRSPINFLVHLMAGLIAYCHQPKKPSLDLGLSLLPLD